jgi:hypothetical protein
VHDPLGNAGAITPNGEGIIMRKYLETLIVVLGVVLSACPALSETFLAIGLPKGGPTHGWVYGYATTRDEALGHCRGTIKSTNRNNGILHSYELKGASEAQQACMIVGNLIGECFGIASNDTPSALGWSIAKREDEAREGAMDRCNAMRSSGSAACILRYAYCDSSPYSNGSAPRN